MKRNNLKFPINFNDTIYCVSNALEKTGNKTTCKICKGDSIIKVGQTEYKCDKCKGLGFYEDVKAKKVIRIFEVKVTWVSANTPRGKLMVSVEVNNDVYVPNLHCFCFTRGFYGSIGAFKNHTFFDRAYEAEIHAKKILKKTKDCEEITRETPKEFKA